MPVDPETLKALQVGGQAVIAIAGSRPVTELVKGLLSAGAALWSTLLEPAFSAVGLGFGQNISDYFVRNREAVGEKAATMLKERAIDPATVRLHPRLGIAVLQQSGTADSDLLQEMWAGLLVSSVDATAPDDGNIIFVNLLSLLTTTQARLFRYACESVDVVLDPAGIVHAPRGLKVPLAELENISGVSDFLRLDRELDHLRMVGIMGERTGFPLYGDIPVGVAVGEGGLNPTTLGLQLYAHCNGAKDIVAFYELKPPTPS
jgi:hypothetical protein